MKTRISIGLMILTIIMMITGCSPAILIQEQEVQPQASIEDYYPFVPNRILVYRGTGSEYADSAEYVDFKDHGSVQTRTVTDGTTLARVFRFRESSVVMTYAQEEFYAWGTLVHLPDNRNEILLKMPLKAGNEWVLEDGRIRTISETDVMVRTPAGSFNTLKVTTEGQGESVQHVYLAPGIGPVKSVFESGGSVIETTLTSIEDDVGFDIPLLIYYPEGDDEAAALQPTLEVFQTNDSIEEKLTALFNEAPGELFPVFPNEIQVRQVRVDPLNRRVKIDFSEEMLHMNVGTYQEGLILQSVTNTLAHFYGMDAVILTVEGGPYESGHYMIGPEDELIPDYLNSKPL
jgi:hypothetical protein